MKKLLASIVCMVVLCGTFSSLTEAKAASKTVEYGAAWSYGAEIVINGRRGWSNLMSSTRDHSSTVRIGEGSSASGTVKAGTESKASRVAGYTASGNYYYNIW